MRVTIDFTTQIKAALGIGQACVDIQPGTTVETVLRSFQQAHPDPFSQLVFDGRGALLPSLLICVNDEQIAAPGERELSDGDTVTLLSAISGG